MRTEEIDPRIWLDLTLKGSEGEDDGSGDTGDDNDEETTGKEPKVGQLPSGKTGEEEDEKDTSGLKSALAKERNARRQAEKQTKELLKFKQDFEDRDKSESEKAQKAATAAIEKATKLASRLRDTATENVIAKLATKHGFVDVDDALRLLDRADIGVEQDEDDPSEITIDEKSVDAALKKLAANKPHLLGEASDGLPNSGSKFNSKRGNQADLDEAALRAKYPAFGRSV